MKSGQEMLRKLSMVLVAALSGSAALMGPAASNDFTNLVNVDPAGVPGRDFAESPSISADGRFVAFVSAGTDLLRKALNGQLQVFVRDVLLRRTEIVSLGPDGHTEGSGGSFDPSISADGRFVAFASDAANLVTGDTNGQMDVFVRDRAAGTTRLVSVGPGRGQGDGPSEHPAISADGRFVAFESEATNLVKGDTDGRRDVFAADLRAGKVERISVRSDGGQGNGSRVNPAFPSISGNGRFVAFVSDAANLVPGDTNRTFDVFVKDRKNNKIERINVSSAGRQANGFTFRASISADGRHVAFDSSASNLVAGDTNGLFDVFVRDRGLGLTQRMSVGRNGLQANGTSLGPAISAGGGSVAFESSATNLVIGHPVRVRGMFVHRRAGFTREVSVGPAGEQGDSDSRDAAVSADGRYVAFVSSASNLVPGVSDTSVYLRGPRRP